MCTGFGRRTSSPTSTKINVRGVITKDAEYRKKKKKKKDYSIATAHPPAYNKKQEKNQETTQE